MKFDHAFRETLRKLDPRLDEYVQTKKTRRGFWVLIENQLIANVMRDADTIDVACQKVIGIVRWAQANPAAWKHKVQASFDRYRRYLARMESADAADKENGCGEESAAAQNNLKGSTTP